MPPLLLMFALGGLLCLGLATLTGELLARARFPLPEADRRIGRIDGLRGYLALSVMMAHFYIWIQLSRFGGEWRGPPYNFIGQLGGVGVALFFMTTGLVFYPRILAGFRATSWLSVYISRIFRIVPLTAFSVLAISAIIVTRVEPRFDFHYFVAAAEWITAWKQVPLLGYADAGRLNAWVLWSLWYEWVFYIAVLPACALAMDVAKARGWPSVSVPLALLALTLAARMAAWLAGHPIPALAYFPLFAIGMLAYECQRVPWLSALLARRGMGALAFAGLILGMAATNSPYDVALPLFALFFCCVASGNSMGGIFATKGAQVLGECSFGIYLLHGMLLDLSFTELAPLHAGLPLAALPVLLPLLGIAVTLFAAGAYLLVERPMIAAGRVLARRLAGRGTRLRPAELEVAP